MQSALRADSLPGGLSCTLGRVPMPLDGGSLPEMPWRLSRGPSAGFKCRRSARRECPGLPGRQRVTGPTMNASDGTAAVVVTTRRSPVDVAELWAGRGRDAHLSLAPESPTVRVLWLRTSLVTGGSAGSRRSCRPPTEPVGCERVRDLRSGPWTLMTGVDCAVREEGEDLSLSGVIAETGRSERPVCADARVAGAVAACSELRTRPVCPQRYACAIGPRRTKTTWRGDANGESEPSRRGAQRVGRDRSKRHRGAFQCRVRSVVA